MPNNNFRGRQQNITGQGKDIKKRDDGLGTGPVGDTSGRSGSSGGSGGSKPPYGGAPSSGHRPPHGGPRPGQPPMTDTNFTPTQQTSSARKNVTRGGSISLIAIVIVAVILLSRGGGLSGLLGGGAASSPASGSSSGTTTTPSAGSGLLDALTGIGSSSGTSSGSSASGGLSGSALSGLLGSLGGGSVSTGWDQTSNTGKLNSSVDSSARAKRTSILGGGKDTVTLMVYMCGTDLESRNGMATADLQEMTKATIGSNVNLIVYTGGCRQWKNTAISNQYNQIYKVETGKIYRLEDNMGSAAMTKPSTLTSFINYCAKNYPANRNCLIFWDHGGGSLTGYGYDEKNQSAGSMTLSGINTALKDGDIRYYDFIGFDACLMATVETALTLSNYADYMIASEETEPGVGWYYTDWLTKLSKNTSMVTTEIGKNIADSFVKECSSTCAGQKTTLSVVDLAELEATVPAELKSFASSTSALLDGQQYEVVSSARTSTREFASSSRIDQVDLVHLCYNMGTPEAKELADAILGAVKYNVTSSNMTNAYGLSIYFPYQKVSSVNNAVSTYQAIGMDSEYMECIQKFASMEAGGQAVAGGASNPLSSLLGAYSGSYSGGSGAVGNDMISALLGSMMSGSSSGGVAGLSGLASAFMGKSLDLDSATEYLSENRFDADALTWKDGVIALSEEQWALVNDLQLNVFYDDGEGYIDLGLDTLYSFTDDGALEEYFSGAWLAINGQPVPYYFMDLVDTAGDYTMTGRVPVMVNGVRADLIIIFDEDTPEGRVAGVRYDYRNGETDTVAKSFDLQEGDTIDFLCDYYSYDGVYQDSYCFGDQLVYDGTLTVSDAYIPNPENVRATFRFTDIYGQYYWSEVIE